MLNKRTLNLPAFVMAIMLSTPSFAQTLLMRDWGGGVQGVVSLDMASIYTDNFFFQNKDTSDPISAHGYLVRPNVAVDLDSSNTSLKIRAAGEYSKHDLPSTFAPQDEYIDGFFSGDFSWLAGTRNRVQLTGEFRRGHDALGTFRTETGGIFVNTDPDTWNRTNVVGVYRFGAKEAAINFELTGKSADKTYVTNESSTRYLDNQLNTVQGVLFFNYSPKTALLLSISHAITRFDETAIGSPSKDGDETRYHVGIQWKATAKTTGDLRIGLVDHNYEAANQKLTRASWIGSVIWTPAARSTFTLATGQTTQESYLNQAVSIDNSAYSIEWNQRWATRFTTTLTSRLIKSDFIGASTSSFRNDTVRHLGLLAEYSLVRYVSLLASVSSDDRSSSQTSYDYQVIQTIVGLRLTP